MTKQDKKAERDKKMVEWLARREKEIQLEMKRRKELHDRILEEYGIETEHTLVEINPEDHFSYEDEYDFPKMTDDKVDNVNFEITHYGGGKVFVKFDRDSVEFARDGIGQMKHLIQDEDWQPKLIEEGESPYVLSEKEATFMDKGEKFTQMIKDNLDNMDAAITEEREKS